MKLKCKWKRIPNPFSTEKLQEKWPFCPRCNQPLCYTDLCVFCRQEIDQDDERLQKWLGQPKEEM